MKRYKILTAAMAAAVLGGASAMAQFNYQNGDLIAAFGNGGSTDVLVNLGSIANFQQGTAYSQSLSSVLNATFGGVSSSVYWAVFGVNNTTLSPYDHTVTQASPYTVWASLARPDPSVANGVPTVSGNANSQHLAVNQIATITSLTSPGQAGAGLINDFAPSIETVAASLGGFSALVNSTSEPFAGNFGDTWGYNVLNFGSGTSDLFQSNPGNPYTDNQSYLGNFSLSPDGTFAFNPVPEPATWAMIGTGAMALLALRRRK